MVMEEIMAMISTEAIMAETARNQRIAEVMR